MTKALQGLFGCSSPGTRACCGCFDLLARAVCATRLVTVEAVSGFSEVSSTPTKPTKVKDLLLFWHSLTKRACWTFKVFFFMQVDIHTWINKRYSHSHRVRSASPQVSAFGQILFFLWKWWHMWWNVDYEKPSLLLQRYTSCVWIHQ